MEMKFGDRLRVLRKEKRLSQKALAAIIGSSQGYICDLEKGNKSPGSYFLKTLTEYMKIDLNWYLTGTPSHRNSLSPIATKIGKLIEELDAAGQADVLRYVEEKKMLADFKREQKS